MVKIETRGIQASEISEAVHGLRQLVAAWGVEEHIDKIIVASDFANAVRTLLPDKQAIGYDPVHDYGAAIAKTLPEVREGEMRFSMVFDARIFTAREAFLERDYFVIHEIVHVRNDLIRYRTTHTPLVDRPRGRTEYFQENGWRIWDEYCAERTAAESIAEAARAVHPDAKVGFGSTLLFADDVLKRLHDFEPFVKAEIRNFRSGFIGIVETASSVTSRVASIAIQLAYVYALRTVFDDLTPKITLIENEPAYRRYFMEGWDRILRAADEWHREKGVFRPNLVNEIGAGYEAILASCGLRITDAPGGYYVNVADI